MRFSMRSARSRARLQPSVVRTSPFPLTVSAPSALFGLKPTTFLRADIWRRRSNMGRPVTVFTGQWADLPFETICAKARQFGYDGIELPCWGDHFEVDKAVKDKGYVKGRWDILKSYGLKAFAISNHLVGQ